MTFNTLSSVLTVKKIFFFILLILLSSLFFIFLPKKKIEADITKYPIENKFISALQNSDENFFTSISSEENKENEKKFIENILKKYSKKMDISVYQKNNFLFYSFLGIEKGSTLLKNIYGSWNAKTHKITAFDTIIFSIMEKSNNTIIFTNNSSIAIPVDNSFILIPSEIKGKGTFSEKLLLPGDSFIFTSEKNIPENILQIESINYGYKAIVQ